LNLIIIKPEELSGGIAEISGDRVRHIVKVLKSSVGDSIRVGLLGGMIGEGKITSISADSVVIAFKPLFNPPKSAGLSVILALPRPKVFRRILFAMVSAGVKDIHLINSWRVEKSYWESPYISEESVERISLEALQQAKDTVMPNVTRHRYFTNFINDALPAMPDKRYLAHPYDGGEVDFSTPCVVAIGCEGGFVEKEVESFISNGFKSFSLGERILTTEHAVPFILGKFL